MDDAGGFTGSILGCRVTGTLALGMTYSGNAPITFVPVSGSPTLYQRTIIYLIKATDNPVIAYGQLTRR
ncbi:hypothetical protein [Burkholderia sp. WSM2230]|uniref:hypothetical protein n=1 Tax=Burkholderia sp. WSM2230 TaxID=944435 RepID=UPI0003FACE57|nr:hypothetical protein [Burkholderia sp. WSM2230]